MKKYHCGDKAITFFRKPPLKKKILWVTPVGSSICKIQIDFVNEAINEDWKTDIFQWEVKEKHFRMTEI